MLPADLPPDLVEHFRRPVEMRAASTVPHPAPVLKVAPLLCELETEQHGEPSSADVDHGLFSRRIVVRASTSALNPEAMADFKILLRQLQGTQGLPVTTVFTLS